MPEAAGRGSRSGVVGTLLRHPFLPLPWLFYLATMSPTIGMGDTALLIEGIERLRLNSWVNTHNLTVLSGWLLAQLPLGTPAFEANLLSVLYGGATVAAFYGLLVLTFHCRLVATLGASLLAVSHSQWWHSTIAEVYAVNGLFTVAFLALLVRLERGAGRRDLLLLFFLAGLAIFNHVQLGILGVGAAVYLAARMLDDLRAGRPGAAVGEFLRCAAACAVGLAPYAVLFARDVVKGEGSYGLSNALGGEWGEIMGAGGLVEGLKDVAFLIAQQFPSPFLLALPVGAWLALSRARAGRTPGPRALAAVAAMFLLNTLYFAAFPTWDRFAYLLPSFIVLAWLGCFALQALRERARASRPATAALLVLGALSVAAPPWVYAQSSRWAAEGGWLAERYNPDYAGNIVDLAAFIGNPDKRGYDDVRSFTEQLFAALPEGASYLDDDSRTFHVVRHGQRFEGQRPDLELEMVAAWSFLSWGLSQPEFARRLVRAHKRDQDLFLVSLDEPFSRMLDDPGLTGLRFARFPLGEDGQRWIYKLVTASAGEQELAGLQPLPSVLRAKLSLDSVDLDGPGRTSFRQGASIQAMARFGLAEQGHPVRFVWLAPDGSVARRAPVQSLPVGLRHALGDSLPAADRPGTWTLQVRSRGTTLHELPFEVLAR